VAHTAARLAEIVLGKTPRSDGIGATRRRCGQLGTSHLLAPQGMLQVSEGDLISQLAR